MRGLSIKEPYASLIRYGLKVYETRSWRTNYRGEILICASKTNGRIPKEYRNKEELMSYADLLPDLHFGKAVAKATLVDCIEMTPEFIAGLTDQERACGLYSEGRFAWMLKDIKPIDEPYNVNGKLGLWRISE